MKNLLWYVLVAGLPWARPVHAQTSRVPTAVSTVAGSAAGKGKEHTDGLGSGQLKGWGHLDGSPQEARFKFPFGVAVGPTGWVYVTDTGSRTIRLVK